MRTRTAIVLEDSKDAADVLCTHLHDLGFATRHLVDPMELVSCGVETADLLLLDLVLGRTDGVAVMRQYHALLAGLPILLLSAHSQQVQAAAVRVGLELGLDVRGFLPKPFARSLFQSAVTSALSGRPDPREAIEPTLPDPETLLDAPALHIGFVPRFELRGQRLLGFEARYLLRREDAQPLPLGRLFDRASAGTPRARLHDRLVGLALDELGAWSEHGALRCWMPVPASRLADTRLAEQLARACERAGTGPDQLRLLLAEEELARRFDALIGPLARVAMKGIEITLDDFGAGLSILSRLHCIPCSELRLAGALTDAVLHSGRNEALVAKCIELAHELEREVSVTGLATGDALDRLKLMGCDHADGSAFGAPYVNRDGARALAAMHGRRRAARRVHG